MISKLITGRSFSSLCAYLCKDQSRATVLQSEGVREYNYKLMAMDFERQKGMNQSVKSPVLHMILSYYPGEKLDDSILTKIALEYLGKLGIQNTQFAIIKHSDRKHLHTHIIVNRIDNDGRTIKDNWIGLKAKKIAQSLTLQYGLQKAEKKTAELTQLERRSRYEVIRYEIYQHIHELLPHCTNLDALQKKLEKLQVEMIYTYKGVSHEIQGISFRKEGFKYKGSEIDRSFSYRNLQKALLINREKLAKLPLNMSRPASSYLLETLLRPERDEDLIPKEFLHRKKGRSL